MSTWTTPALEKLDDYLNGSRQRAAAAGADADEVAADLRRHVEAEVAQLNLPVVTEGDIQQILARTGLLAGLAEIEPSSEPKTAGGKRPLKLISSASLLLFGVLLPVATLAIELMTHICAGSFFDPLPSWVHVVLVGTVPIGNAAVWWISRQSLKRVPRWLWWLNAIAVGVALYYALLFLPMLPLALIGILFFGFGLLPLTPVISLVVALRCHFHLRTRFAESSGTRPAGWWWITAGSVVLLVLFMLPGPLTRHWLDLTDSEFTEESQRAVRMLRMWGNDDVLLKECYGRGDRWSMELFNNRRVDPLKAQKAYYRVTGKPYNSVPPPLSKYQGTARALFDEFEWDEGLGGESVAGQVRSLSLDQSRLDGICRPDEGWAYLEWIMEFRNDHPFNPREARAHVQLPPGAVVSRVTLWVNGEPREAAFAGRGEVRAAYQKIAVQQRRDPVLVTMSGPDQVLVQCFPVPAQGGLMKIRLGITAPVLVEDATSALLPLPSISERNFKVARGLQHSFWLETPQKAEADFAPLIVTTNAAGRIGIRGQIAEATLNQNPAVLRFTVTPGKLASVNATDSKVAGRVVRQTLDRMPAQMPGRIAVVLDGSAGMKQFFPEVARALAGIPAGAPLAVWLAGEDVEQVFDGTSRGSSDTRTASSIVSALRAVGGQDNVPALLEAWEWASTTPGGAVLWIHASKPLLLSGVESLRQRLEWNGKGGGPTIYDIPVEPGPNIIAQQLQRLNAFSALPRTGALSADLDRLFGTWSGRREQLVFHRVVVPGADTNAATGSSHIVRLWAAQHVNALTRSRKVRQAVELAGEQQLVTEVSGAVVLETQEQYVATGLNPADPASVPVVPEPANWALLLFGAATLFILNRNRPRRKRDPQSTGAFN